MYQEAAKPRITHERRTLWDRYVRKFGPAAKPVLYGFLTAAGAGLFVVVKAVLQTPGRVTLLAAQVSVIDSTLKSSSAKLDSTQRGQSVANAFKCFEIPDSIFRGSLTPCGEAFIASRIDPSIWRRPTPIPTPTKVTR